MNSRVRLQIREDKKSGIYVEGLLEEIIENVDDMQKLIVKVSECCLCTGSPMSGS